MKQSSILCVLLQGKRGFVKPPFELPEFIKVSDYMVQRNL